MDLVAVIERESAALRDAATDLAAPVPACPGWDVAEVLLHVGSAHHNAARIVGEQLQQHPSRAELQPPEGADPIDWLGTSTAVLAHALRTTDPTTPVWSFGADRTAAFWARRMAHETMVHRVDVERATNRSSEIDAALAADGIAESLGVFVPMLHGRTPAGAEGDLLVHSLDGPSWIVSFRGDELAVVDDHRQGDACVQGSSADLLLWLWGRAGDDAVTFYGDPALPERLAGLTRV